MGSITHSKITGAAADPNALLDGPAWDAGHVFSLGPSDVGLGNVPNVDATNAANITSGVLADARMSYNQGSAGSVARLYKARLQDHISIADFGAVGDGNIANASVNATALTDALATGKVVFIPWTSAGYHFGTNQISVGDGGVVMGERNVLLKSTATTSLFLMTGGGGAPSTIQNSYVMGLSVDMTGAGSSSAAFLMNTGAQNVSHVRISNIRCSNCYAFYKEPSSAANYVYNLEVSDIECTLPLGTQIDSQNTQGFIHFKSVNVDCTLAGQTLVTWASIHFTNFAGLRLTDIDVTGQAGALGASASFQSGAIGVQIIGVGTNVGKTFVWLERVRVESAQGTGVAISNTNFVYADLLESFGSIGNGIVVTGCNYGQIGSIYGHGFKGNTGAISNASGIIFDTCGQSGGTRSGYGSFVVSNLASEQNTGEGLLVNNTMGLQIGSVRVQDNGTWGIQETQSVAGYTNYNTYLGVDAYNNTSGDLSLIGSQSAAPLDLSSNVRSPLPVSLGGTGLSSGTSGGILAYTAAGTLASSAALTQNGVVIGGGAGTAPSSTAQGSAGKVLTGNGASPPTFQSVSQAIPFTGNPGASGGTTLYAFMSGSTTEGVAQGVSALSGTFSKLFVSVTTAPGVSNTIVATLRVNGADTAVTCTISGTNTTASDLTHTAAITAGQSVSVKLVYSASAAASFPSGGVVLSNP